MVIRFILKLFVCFMLSTSSIIYPNYSDNERVVCGSPHKTYNPDIGSVLSDDLYQIASPDGGARLLFAEVDSGCGIYQLVANSTATVAISDSATTTTGCRTAFTTAAADTSNPYSPPSV